MKQNRAGGGEVEVSDGKVLRDAARIEGVKLECSVGMEFEGRAGGERRPVMLFFF